MKLDEKYFKKMYAEVYASEFDMIGLISIIKQIARDAADAQRERCSESLASIHVPEDRSQDFLTGFLMALVLAKGGILNAALDIPDGE